MAYSAGIDIGSTFTKAVVLSDSSVMAACTIPSGGSYRNSAQQAMTEALARSGLTYEDVVPVVATGYGAAINPFPSRRVTELACQGRAINHLFPSARTVVDIGGQATRVIRINAEGKVVGFELSEICAGGSGRFLQLMARVLGIDFDDIGPLSLKAKKAVVFSTSCAVFAESEAISRISEGAAKEDILAGVHAAMAAKVYSMLQRIKMERDCALTGGGARDRGLVKSIEEQLGIALLVPQEAQLTAALGAALIGR